MSGGGRSALRTKDSTSFPLRGQNFEPHGANWSFLIIRRFGDEFVFQSGFMEQQFRNAVEARPTGRRRLFAAPAERSPKGERA